MASYATILQVTQIYACMFMCTHKGPDSNIRDRLKKTTHYLDFERLYLYYINILMFIILCIRLLVLCLTK